MSPRLALLAAVMLAGCQFDPIGLSGEDQGDDDGAEAGDDGSDDAPPPASETPTPTPGEFPPLEGVAHVPPEGWYGGTADLELTDGEIDTDDLTLPIAIPDGVAFDVFRQDDGPEVAVLHVNRFDLPTGTVTVQGSRALVIVAAADITIGGVLDAGARQNQPGPGGSLPADGPGVGGPGVANSDRHSGGGGAGSAFSGAKGGDATTLNPFADDSTGGDGGGPHLDNALAVLEGGSGGGPGIGCITDPGGGGGAVQLTTPTVVTVTGAVTAGGGGGGGGLGEGEAEDACGGFGSGGGGGGGGAIYIQADDLVGDGQLSVNGGGGGGGGGDEGNGQNGEDGAAGNAAAVGGGGGGGRGAAGGAGGVANVADPQAGDDDGGGEGNGGGGGGGPGVVVIQ
jgi:hypothetical protein